eukprot:2359210-Pleurochrysis_carterae.AAC.1
MDDHANRVLAYIAQHADEGIEFKTQGVAADRLLQQRLGSGAFDHRLLHHVRRNGGGLRLKAPTLYLPLIDRSWNRRSIAHRC